MEAANVSVSVGVTRRVASCHAIVSVGIGGAVVWIFVVLLI